MTGTYISYDNSSKVKKKMIPVGKNYSTVLIKIILPCYRAMAIPVKVRQLAVEDTRNIDTEYGHHDCGRNGLLGHKSRDVRLLFVFTLIVKQFNV